MCILGSRQQMCVHPTVSRMNGPACNQACKALTAKRQCPWCDAVLLCCTSTTSPKTRRMTLLMTQAAKHPTTRLPARVIDPLDYISSFRAL